MTNLPATVESEWKATVEGKWKATHVMSCLQQHVLAMTTLLFTVEIEWKAMHAKSFLAAAALYGSLQLHICSCTRPLGGFMKLMIAQPDIWKAMYVKTLATGSTTCQTKFVA